jgi:glutamate decarboxylase
VFYVNYLGDEMASYTLNFSRGSGMLLAQYYNLLRLGWKGYAMAAGAVLENAQYLTKRLLDTGYFDILNAGEILPVVTFQIKEPVDFSVYDLSAKLRERGWIVPAYTLRPNAEAIPLCASSSGRTSVATWQISSLTTLRRRTPLCWRLKPRQS